MQASGYGYHIELVLRMEETFVDFRLNRCEFYIANKRCFVLFFSTLPDILVYVLETFFIYLSDGYCNAPNGGDKTTVLGNTYLIAFHTCQNAGSNTH